MSASNMPVLMSYVIINVKNFHGNLTAVVRAQKFNDTSKKQISLIPVSFSIEHTGIATAF